MSRLDSRGWIAIGCYSLVIVILLMIGVDRTLLDNQAFLVLATAIIVSGWNGGPVGWAYQATKSGGELADRNAGIAERAAASPAPSTDSPAGTPDDPVSVTETPRQPVPGEYPA